MLFSAPINGARRWFDVGGLGIQPSELAKIACMLFTALILERRMHRIDEISYSLLPIAIVVGAMAGLILLEPDFGTAISLLMVVAVMVFAAGLELSLLRRHRARRGTASCICPDRSAPYRLRRLLAFMDPGADPLGDGFQIIQSLIAVGTGGVFGRGLMGGVQKLFFLPEPHTDFIYAVIGEELGLIGATGVLICFCVIAWRGAAHRAARGGRVRVVRRARAHHDDRRAGVREHQRRARAAADQGHSAAARQLRRVVAADQPAGMGVLLNISQHETERELQ